ncbi:hypothetical protein T492DRAFT_932681 [Pavlovales sp. CCMP2436]|nr:hypothetical protein T492DRAFT_932681 [Pavlovales sp. CCMP2436]
MSALAPVFTPASFLTAAAAAAAASGSGSSGVSAAAAAAGPSAGGSGQHRLSGVRFVPVTCWHCGRFGHMHADCPFRTGQQY